jgi:luciferase family oxidoreductase group 1
MRLSVLDLIGVRAGQTTGEALRASRRLVELADRLGYTRYWVAEHHNTESVASTTPAVELMYLGENTSRIRLGSGGVMLPNHSALAVAEQFSLLAAVYGDRIDLGIGRAPGTDPITSAAIRGHLTGGRYVDSAGKPADPVREFPGHIQEIQALLSPGGAVFRLPTGGTYQLRPAPDVQHPPQIWLLGSSDYSARLAAELGLPYVFAHHFRGRAPNAPWSCTEAASGLPRHRAIPGPEPSSVSTSRWRTPPKRHGTSPSRTCSRWRGYARAGRWSAHGSWATTCDPC